MTKSDTTLKELTQLVREFCECRDWDQFHHAKDLAIGLVTESSELLELFRFRSTDEVDSMFESPVERSRIADEMADVFYFVLRLSMRYGVDLEIALKDKLKQNALKYPVELSKGRNQKYTDL